MRWLVISDTHLGAWTGDNLLTHEWACETLRPELERADEVVLLGDFVDLLFANTEQAFRSAGRFVDLLAQTLSGKRLVWLAGNHDHHVLVRRLESLIELRVATGEPDEQLRERWQSGFYFEAFLRRRLPGTEIDFAYPSYRVGDVLLSHGHYLDGEVRGSVPNRLLQGGMRRLGGWSAAAASIEDYEAALVPLTELLYVQAQLPKGAWAEQRIQSELRRIAQAAAIVAAPGRELVRLGRAIGLRAQGKPAPRPPAADYMLARVVRPGTSVWASLNAYAHVCRNLGWDREAKWFVFAHTHQPLAGVHAAATGSGARFWNTGSWIYEPPDGSVREYLRYVRHNWPGSAIVIDTVQRGGEPQLIELLAADREALRAWFHSSNAPSVHQVQSYADVRRLLGRT
ncbi:MAG: metallophosphoesterase [Solirubrobacterales bacterium]|nr:metallophosphoesterase [Solirubrobacterales bacterium]